MFYSRALLASIPRTPVLAHICFLVSPRKVFIFMRGFSYKFAHLCQYTLGSFCIILKNHENPQKYVSSPTLGSKSSISMIFLNFLFSPRLSGNLQKTNEFQCFSTWLLWFFGSRCWALRFRTVNPMLLAAFSGMWLQCSSSWPSEPSETYKHPLWLGLFYLVRSVVVVLFYSLFVP